VSAFNDGSDDATGAVIEGWDARLRARGIRLVHSGGVPKRGAVDKREGVA